MLEWAPPAAPGVKELPSALGSEAPALASPDEALTALPQGAGQTFGRLQFAEAQEVHMKDSGRAGQAVPVPEP